jgi:hypothetical protein
MPFVADFEETEILVVEEDIILSLNYMLWYIYIYEKTLLKKKKK